MTIPCPAIAPYIEKTQKSPAVDSKDHVKLFKLAWDALGSEFGSRHTQYEMFYAGAAFVTRGHAFRTYTWEQVTAMVEGLLARYDLPQGVPADLGAERGKRICSEKGW